MSDGYWYLGTPYSKYPPELGGIAGAYQRACELAAMMILNGYHVYCPIAHTHPISIEGKLNPFDHELWMPLDEHFMHGAKGLVIGMMAGWEDSYGLTIEREYFAKAGKPVKYMADQETFYLSPEAA